MAHLLLLQKSCHIWFSLDHLEFHSTLTGSSAQVVRAWSGNLATWRKTLLYLLQTPIWRRRRFLRWSLLASVIWTSNIYSSIVMMYHHPPPPFLGQVCDVSDQIWHCSLSGAGISQQGLIARARGEGAGARLKEARDQNVGPLLLLTPHQSVRTKGWVAAILLRSILQSIANETALHQHTLSTELWMKIFQFPCSFRGCVHCVKNFFGGKAFPGKLFLCPALICNVWPLLSWYPPPAPFVFFPAEMMPSGFCLKWSGGRWSKVCRQRRERGRCP